MMAFTLLVLLLSLPFWAVGAVMDASLLPGVPVAAFAVFVPTLAAAIAILRTGGSAELRSLFGRVREVAGLPFWGWIGPVAVPVACGGAAWILRGATGQPVVLALTPSEMLPLAVVLIAAALLEEFGWTAFATDRLTGRFGLLTGALVLGLGWSIWHYPALIQAHRGVFWIGWWTVWSVGQRVAMVALYSLTGRNFAAPVLFHATANFVWHLAPEAFAPAVAALVVSVFALALWLLARRRKEASYKPAHGS